MSKAWRDALPGLLRQTRQGLERMRDEQGGEPETVAIYIYASEADFDAAGGRARYGLDRHEHAALINELARLLRAEGWPVKVETFTGALDEPTNLHEPSAEGRG